MARDTPILETDNVEKHFSMRDSLMDTILRKPPRSIHAVDGVSITLEEKKVVGVIGESGCGKSTLLETMLGLHEPTGGMVKFRGESTANFSKSDWREYRRRVQPIFQDPFNSFDPKMTIRESLREPLIIHGLDDKEERVHDALERARLTPPDRFLDSVPTQLSGGELQRASIARALVLDPDVILADEPVSMLDVSTQAEILTLLDELVSEFNLSMMYISHDLSTVGHLCDTVNVMYLGRVVEKADVMDIVTDPKHPYSEALVNAVPIPDPTNKREWTELAGSPSDPIDIGEGCRFRDRCPDIIPPEDLDITQALFRDIGHLRQQIIKDDIDQERIDRILQEASEDATDDEKIDILMNSLIKSEISDRHRTPVSRALQHLLEGNPTEAATALSEYESICEQTPEYIQTDDEIWIACHLYSDMASDPGARKVGEVQ